MAYIAMDSLVNKLTGKLIEEEAKLFHQVEDQVCSLLCMLKSLRPFIQEFQRKQTSNIESSMKEFIKLVNEADDAIDSYITTRRKLDENIFVGEKHIEVDLRNKIEKIKSRLMKWHNYQHYLMASQAPNSMDKYDEMAAIGLDNKATMMMKRLKDKYPGRDVIPIVGPGGVGKTTLACRVYKDSTTQEDFQCQAWVDAHMPSKELLQEIIKQVNREEALNGGGNDHNKPEKIILRELAIQIFDLLKKKRYLLVFDDVCRTQFWADVDMIFPNNDLGSKIIFTTRYDEVAESARPRRRPFYLQPTLSKEQRLELFISKIRISRSNAATTSGEGGGGGALVLVKSPWKECVESASGGLPSAILELAAEHERVRTSGGNGEDVGEQTWKLIYSNLPHYLKPCFLYLGILNSCCYTQFQELMIAEGFVNGQQPLTEIAVNYLNELLDRKLVEVVSKHWDGRIKEIGIPKWLNFSKSEAGKENLVEFWDVKKEAFSWEPNSGGGVMSKREAERREAERIWISLPFEANRVTVQGLSKGVIGVINSALKVLRDTGTTTSPSSPLHARSFLILPSEGGEARDEITIPWEFLDGNLRVLDVFLSDMIEAIPAGDIERLKHLRYLRLNYRGFKGEKLLLPQTICNLWNLQFIRMKNRSARYFSSEFKWEGFWRMRHLKHLLCSDILLSVPDQSLTLQKDAVVLENLERLKHLSIACCNEANLSKVPNLVRLGIGGNIQPKYIQEILPNSLRLLKSLEKLSLQGAGDNAILPVPECNLDLFPPSITRLTLKRTRLQGDIMRLLEKLPNLKVLKLTFNAIEGEVLGFTQKRDAPDMDSTATGYGFPQLKCLKLEDINIKKWDQSVGAMPSLEIVVIHNCIHLHDLPLEALQNTQSLQVLELYNILPAVKTAAQDIQKCIGKDRLQLRVTELGGRDS